MHGDVPEFVLRRSCSMPGPVRSAPPSPSVGMHCVPGWRSLRCGPGAGRVWRTGRGLGVLVGDPSRSMVTVPGPSTVGTVGTLP